MCDLVTSPKGHSIEPHEGLKGETRGPCPSLELVSYKALLGRRRGGGEAGAACRLGAYGPKGRGR